MEGGLSREASEGAGKNVENMGGRDELDVYR